MSNFSNYQTADKKLIEQQTKSLAPAVCKAGQNEFAYYDNTYEKIFGGFNLYYPKYANIYRRIMKEQTAGAKKPYKLKMIKSQETEYNHDTGNQTPIPNEYDVYFECNCPYGRTAYRQYDPERFNICLVYTYDQDFNFLKCITYRNDFSDITSCQTAFIQCRRCKKIYAIGDIIIETNNN